MNLTHSGSTAPTYAAGCAVADAGAGLRPTCPAPPDACRHRNNRRAPPNYPSSWTSSANRTSPPARPSDGATPFRTGRTVQGRRQTVRAVRSSRRGHLASGRASALRRLRAVQPSDPIDLRGPPTGRYAQPQQPAPDGPGNPQLFSHLTEHERSQLFSNTAKGEAARAEPAPRCGTLLHRATLRFSVCQRILRRRRS